MRQNCLPQTVYLASSTQMISVAIAAIVQAWTSHDNDDHSSLPQSRVGVNPADSDSIPAKYPDELRTALWTSQLPAVSVSSRHSPSPTSASCGRGTAQRWRGDSR